MPRTIGPQTRVRNASDRTLVYRVEEDMDLSEIYATTYQMRNFFRQFADGFFSSLDVMNYIQHHKAVLMTKSGDRVLDVCCGRGLLLPLLRYYRPKISEYVGIDIHKPNINEQLRRSGIKKIDGLDYYPFPMRHIICSCEDMDQELEKNSFNIIIYTSAIEHMQKEVGLRSLENCWNLLKPGGLLFLSCPNTQDKKNPYDTQYAAHLYEWDLEELSGACKALGFRIDKIFGLVAKAKPFKKFIEKMPENTRELYLVLWDYLPTNWAMSLLPIPFPEQASEVLLLVRKPRSGRGFF